MLTFALCNRQHSSPILASPSVELHPSTRHSIRNTELSPSPDLLNQNLRFRKMPVDSHEHESFRSSAAHTSSPPHVHFVLLSNCQS